MSAEANPVTEVLERTSKGKGTFQELAASLKSLDNMAVIIPPAEFARFMQDLETARKERERKVANGELPASEIHVKVTDVENPRLNGIQTKDGFVPRVFTSDQIAREFAVTSGLIEPDEALPFMTKDWVTGFQEFLFNGYVGVVIDDGSEHKVNLARDSVARVFAYMTFEAFAKLPVLHAVTLQGKPFFQPSSSGGHQAFIYDNPKAASYGVAQLQKSAAGFSTAEFATGALLSQLLRAGVTVLVVNHAVPDTRLYNRDDLVQMVELIGPATGSAESPAPPPSVAPPDPALNPQARTAAGAISEAASDMPAPLKRALARPALPPVPVPEQNDVDSQMLFHEFKNKADQKSIEIFQLVEALAFQIKFYALVHPRPVDGLTWPQFFRSPDDENQTMTYLYTTEEAAQKAVENDPPELRRIQALSGIEAMRWVWSAPKNIDNIAIDYYPNSPAWMSFPSYWVLSAVFPHFYGISDLKKVPSAGLANLGALPGARGLKPEVARALVFGWKQLLGLEPRNGNPSIISHEGKRYLPVFSDADQFLAFTSSPNGVQGRPKPLSGRQAPFAGWLEATVDCDGVILDPAGAQPLKLDHTDLLVLDLWAGRPGAGPDGWSIINGIARLLYEKKIPATLAGRILADYPRYWLGFGQTPDGGGALLMVPKTDACALFTSQDLAQQYLEFYRSLDSVRSQVQDMQPTAILSRWQMSALAVAGEQFTEVAIDPDPYGTGGLYLGRDALDAALERIDDKLKPRVPGFIAEA